MNALCSHFDSPKTAYDVSDSLLNLAHNGKCRLFEPRGISYLFGVIVRVRVVFRKTVGKWFEPRSISCLSSVIVQVRVVFRKTVVGD